MRFPNAYNGIKKVFLAQILMVISIAAIIIGAAITVVTFSDLYSLSSVEELYGSVAVLSIATLGGVVISIIAFIINAIGLHAAGKDEGCFRIAFWMTIIALALSVVSSLLQTANPSLSGWFQFVGNILEIAVIEYAVMGIISLAEQLSDNKVASMGRKLRILITVLWIVILALAIFRIFTNVELVAVIALAGALLELVVYIIYIILVGRAKGMLAKS